jgi:hypothetical protein
MTCRECIVIAGQGFVNPRLAVWRMPDLIDDGTWREAALARMSEVFVTNRGLRPMQVIADGIVNQM